MKAFVGKPAAAFLALILGLFALWVVAASGWLGVLSPLVKGAAWVFGFGLSIGGAAGLFSRRSEPSEREIEELAELAGRAERHDRQ